MKNLQKEYQLIKEGKGNKGYFLSQARRLFPDLISQYNSYGDCVKILKSKRILNEVETVKTAPTDEDFVTEFKKNIVDKDVLASQIKNFDFKDLDNVNNLNGQSVLTGFIAEMYVKENKEKTVAEIIDIVAKNLKKDPLFYIKDGQFGLKGVGYVESPKTKETKGKYKSSGAEEVVLKESKEAKSVRHKGGPPKWKKDGFPDKPKYLLKPGTEIEIKDGEDQGLEDGKYMVNSSYWDNDEWNYDLTKMNNDGEFEGEVHSFTADYIHGRGYWRGHGVLKELKKNSLRNLFEEEPPKDIQYNPYPVWKDTIDYKNIVLNSENYETDVDYKSIEKIKQEYNLQNFNLVKKLINKLDTAPRDNYIPSKVYFFLYPEQLEESLGEKGDEVEVMVNKSNPDYIEYTLYDEKNRHQIDMFFDSPTEVLKFIEKKGLVLTNPEKLKLDEEKIPSLKEIISTFNENKWGTIFILYRDYSNKEGWDHQYVDESDNKEDLIVTAKEEYMNENNIEFDDIILDKEGLPPGYKIEEEQAPI